MNLDFYESIAVSAQNLANHWAMKISVSWVLAIEFHLSLFCLFTALVFLDLFTRWIAIAHAMLINGGVQGTGIYDCIRAIPEAHRMGMISSGVMRRQFCNKIITYMLVVLGGILVDNSLVMLHKSPMALALIITYLSMTELLSMMENLDEAGISAVHNLVDLLKGRRGR